MRFQCPGLRVDCVRVEVSTLTKQDMRCMITGCNNIFPTCVSLIQHLFHQGYRMQRSLFFTILDRVCSHDNWSCKKKGCSWVHIIVFSPKDHLCITYVCYSFCAEATNVYCWISESTTIEPLKHFCLAIWSEFEEYHLKQPALHKMSNYRLWMVKQFIFILEI